MKLKWSPHYSFLYLRFITPQQGQLREKTDYIRYHIHAIEFCPSLLGISTKNVLRSWNVHVRSWRFPEFSFNQIFCFIVYAIQFVCVYFPKANTINFWKVEYKNVFPYAIIAVALAIKYEIEWRMEICCLFYVGKTKKRSLSRILIDLDARR